MEQSKKNTKKCDSCDEQMKAVLKRRIIMENVVCQTTVSVTVSMTHIDTRVQKKANFFFFSQFSIKTICSV